MAKGSGNTSNRTPLSFSDNSRSAINAVSAPYDKLMRDYTVGFAFDNYTSGSTAINDVARTGTTDPVLLGYDWSGGIDDVKDAISSLDEAFDKMPPLDRDIDLFRSSSTIGSQNIQGLSINSLNKLKGTTFVDKGYTSFTFKNSIAKEFNEESGRDVTIVLKAKKGQKGASLANTSSYNSAERQEEFLFPRNGRYKIIGARKIGGGKYLFIEKTN